MALKGIFHFPDMFLIVYWGLKQMGVCQQVADTPFCGVKAEHGSDSKQVAFGGWGAKAEVVWGLWSNGACTVYKHVALQTR